MPHVVTQPCCADASCAFACPVNAIHPTPDEPDFVTADMVYIDPDTCVDCGACIKACPVGAIKPDTKLSEAELPFVELNRLFHEQRPEPPIQAPVTPIVRQQGDQRLRVAIVGSGPAAMYAADELLKRPHVEVTVIDRLLAPYGLVRAGVAPDHPDTRKVDSLFRQIEDQRGFRYALGVEVGTDVTHQELADTHHAVIYATGASRDRSLGIPGEELHGSATATDFVAWYNGHPDHVDDEFDLSSERAVIVGNGNVSLDVARILTTDPEQLAQTDIADHALDALRDSKVREVVILARRGPAQAAFTLPEITSLVGREDVEIVVEGDLETPADDQMDQQKIEVLKAVPARPEARRRIVFRFQSAPVQIAGTDHVDRVVVARTALRHDGHQVRAELTDEVSPLETGLVLRSVGYRGVPMTDLPFDPTSNTIPNARGRVDGMPGTYVVGWIKRGPSGFIGTNKTCSTETVDRLFEDANAGLLPTPLHRPPSPLVRGAIDLAGWRRIDEIERRRGVAEGRVRVRFCDPDTMRSIAATQPAVPGQTRRAGRVTLRA